MFRTIDSFFTARRNAAREIRRKQTRQRRSQLGCEMPSVQVEKLEERQLLSVTQTITVRDTTGHLLSGVSIAITDAVSCKTPVLTNGNGQVVITSYSGIRTILATKSGYANDLLTINSSASTYSLTLAPLTTGFTTTTSLVSVADVGNLCRSFGSLVYLGQYSMSNVLTNTAKIFAGATPLCGLLLVGGPEASPAAATCAYGTAAAATVTMDANWIYSQGQAMGWVPTNILNFYWSPSLKTIVVYKVH